MAGQHTYPFVAIVGQDDLKQALLLTTLAPELSGVLVRGEKGTAKSTAVRALADILPEQDVIAGCPFRLAPGDDVRVWEQAAGGEVDASPTDRVQVPVVELPVGATEDRVAGTLNLEKALTTGERRFEPGILAAAHRAILYVDEVNLLDDHVVDLLLDSAAMGVNTVEREGMSLTHPSAFSLVGTMNPEEGELRPQLLDRFGLCVTVAGSEDPAERVQVVKRRLAFEADPAAFCATYADASAALAGRIRTAQKVLPDVTVTDEQMLEAATISVEAGVDGHRADIMMVRAGRALAAWDERTAVSSADIQHAARFVLPHRMRRQPLEDIAPVR